MAEVVWGILLSYCMDYQSSRANKSCQPGWRVASALELSSGSARHRPSPVDRQALRRGNALPSVGPDLLAGGREVSRGGDRPAIDVDGTDPLNVLSGALNGSHFIGRVTSSDIGASRARLILDSELEDGENFVLQWPYERVRVERIQIDVRSCIRPPTAEVRFFGGRGRITYGPYTVVRISPYFRDVEIDVDREEGARAIHSCRNRGVLGWSLGRAPRSDEP
jgi:hypothetical protein